MLLRCKKRAVEGGASLREQVAEGGVGVGQCAGAGDIWYCLLKWEIVNHPDEVW